MSPTSWAASSSTGAHSGIGFEVARVFRSRPRPHDPLARRNTVTVEEARERLARLEREVSTEVLRVDLANLESVRGLRRPIHATARRVRAGRFPPDEGPPRTGRPSNHSVDQRGAIQPRSREKRPHTGRFLLTHPVRQLYGVVRQFTPS